MEKKKLTRKSLNELAIMMPILSEIQQKTFVGGGDGTYGNPYTWEEYSNFLTKGTWYGGYVDGYGFVDSSGSYDSGTYYDTSGSYGIGDSGSTSGSYNQNDGVNIYNADHFSFNTGNTTFDSQLTTLLKSNSVLKSVLSYFDKGIVHMTFEVNNLQTPDGSVKVAVTNFTSPESYHIIFNSDLINGSGWNNTYTGIDNMGYDLSQGRTMEEKLLITLTHEAMHANHYARYQEALRNNDNKSHLAAIDLINRGYSEGFVDIFFNKDGNGIWQHENTADAIEKNMHDYMETWNRPLIDAALAEYRRDYGN